MKKFFEILMYLLQPGWDNKLRAEEQASRRIEEIREKHEKAFNQKNSSGPIWFK